MRPVSEAGPRRRPTLYWELMGRMIAAVNSSSWQGAALERRRLNLRPLQHTLCFAAPNSRRPCIQPSALVELPVSCPRRAELPVSSVSPRPFPPCRSALVYVETVCGNSDTRHTGFGGGRNLRIYPHAEMHGCSVLVRLLCSCMSIGRSHVRSSAEAPLETRDTRALGENY